MLWRKIGWGRARMALALIALYYLDNIVLSDMSHSIRELAIAPWLLAMLPSIPSLLGGIGGGLMSNVQAGIDRQASLENTELSAQKNMEMAKFAYSQDLDMWNRQNEYNSPEAQMLRLSQAGLNPNLVYGQGAVGNFSGGSAPKFNAPTVQYNAPAGVNLPSMIAQFQDVQIRQAQLDNLREQRSVIKESAAQKGFLNEVLENTGESRLWEQIYKGNRAREEYSLAGSRAQMGKLDLAMKAKSFDTQLEFQKEKLRGTTVGISKVLQDTELQKLRTDWFIAQAISKMGLDLASQVTKMRPMGRGINQKMKNTGGIPAGDFLKRYQNSPAYFRP